MSLIELKTGNSRCLRMLDKVTETAEILDNAYAFRSRLGRLVLASLSLVADREGFPRPKYPGPWHIPECAEGRNAAVADACQAVFQLSSLACQPSEPLDSRWKATWASLKVELAALKLALEGME